MMQKQQTKCQSLDGNILFRDVPFRRELKSSDLERMKIPKRYWKSSFDYLSDEGEDSLRSVVFKYISKMELMRKEGGGFIFYGDNGTGKSCASIVIAKEFRRRGSTVLFLEAAEMKTIVANRDHFDEDETYWERAKTVDVLVIDDFGKGIMDDQGFGAGLFDELIRTRNSQKRVTIISTNLSPNKWLEELDLKKSTMEALEECTIPLKVEGKNLRKEFGGRLKEMLASN